MKNNPKVKYLFYLLVIIFFIIISNALTLKANNYAKENFDIFPVVIVNTCIYFLFGVILGLDNFLKEKSCKGVWRVNKPKLLILGLPSLYFSLSLILERTKLVFLYGNWKIFNVSILSILNMKHIYAFSQILLGFIVVTSFYKYNEDEKKRQV